MFMNNEEYYQADSCIADYTDEFTRCGNQVMRYAVTASETTKETKEIHKIRTMEQNRKRIKLK